MTDLMNPRYVIESFHDKPLFRLLDRESGHHVAGSSHFETIAKLAKRRNAKARGEKSA